MRYLSDAWIDAVDDAVRADDTLRTACEDADLVLQQHVTGTPTGDVAYTIRLTPSGARVERGTADDAHVTLRQPYEVAVAIRAGELHALDAVQRGDVEVVGDAARLIAHRDALAALEPAFGA